MRLTKRQLKRIIKEEMIRLREAFPPHYSPGDSTLEITQDKYDRFADEIADGYGWIDADDVARQWEGMFSVDGLSPEALAYLIANLDANGLISTPEEMEEF